MLLRRIIIHKYHTINEYVLSATTCLNLSINYISDDIILTINQTIKKYHIRTINKRGGCVGSKQDENGGREA